MNNILWIRNDLRLEDNTALIQAVDQSYEEKTGLTLVFHINEEQVKLGTHSNDYFFSALKVFYEKVKNLGADLFFLYGNPEEAFQHFFKTHKKINKVFFNRSERGYGLERDKRVEKIFKEHKVAIGSYFDKHLHAVEDVLTIEGKNYKVFTPYYKKWSSLAKNPLSFFDEEKFKSVMNSDFDNIYKVEYEKILKNRQNNYEAACGEDRALEELKEFIENDLADYEDKRDDIFADCNSKLSKYLATGQISIRQVYYSVLEKEDSKGRETYVKQLAWRDFYNMVYYVNPEQHSQEIIEKYRSIKWNDDKYAFNIWKYGLTEYPIVDAGMRELLKTGRMHNRLRMITASFLVKDLLIDWRMGERYFKEMLIDFDSASNIGSWQWVASTGTDACPYFRIFNPTTQSKRFDKKGFYIKSVLDELSEVEAKYIHESHKSKGKDLDYPTPIVNHKEQRLKILDMYKSLNSYDYSTNMKNEFMKRYILFEFFKLKKAGKKELIAFHSHNKYLYFTYSIRLKDKLGQILSQKAPYNVVFDEYKKTLIELFNETPTVKKGVNAYEHVYGYFKNYLNADEKEEYKTILQEYKRYENSDDEVLKAFFKRLADKYQVGYIQEQTLIREF